MSRLLREFARLYLPDPARPEAASLLDDEGRTRALVLEVAPAAWEPLRAIWQGVQTDLGLPPPAPAVSGHDGLQLWFSAPLPVPVDEARQFLSALVRRYGPELPAQRLRLWPVPASAPGAPPQQVARVPALQADGERWSAFVAPDLAPLFVDTPWLDVAPTDEGQAGLLAPLASMPATWLADSLAMLAPAPASLEAPRPASLPGSAPGSAPSPPPPPIGRIDPRAFLHSVLDDEAAPLALRVKAAKALLGR